MNSELITGNHKSSCVVIILEQILSLNYYIMLFAINLIEKNRT